MVNFDKNNLILTFESMKKSAVAGTYSINVYATLQKYPYVPALQFPFVFKLLEGPQTSEITVNQES